MGDLASQILNLRRRWAEIFAMRRPQSRKFPELAPTIEALQAIMDRLDAADLTMAEARDLRFHLFRLLESIEAENLPTIGAPDERKTSCDSRRCLIV